MDVPSALPTEFDLLCAVVRPHVDAVRVHALLREVRDSARVLKLATQHSGVPA
jgi:hypothetical protein